MAVCQWVCVLPGSSQQVHRSRSGFEQKLCHMINVGKIADESPAENRNVQKCPAAKHDCLIILSKCHGGQNHTDFSPKACCGSAGSWIAHLILCFICGMLGCMGAIKYSTYIYIYMHIPTYITTHMHTYRHMCIYIYIYTHT